MPQRLSGHTVGIASGPAEGSQRRCRLSRSAGVVWVRRMPSDTAWTRPWAAGSGRWRRVWEAPSRRTVEAVRGPALPRAVHEQPALARHRGEDPPRPRGRGGRHRRPEGQRPGPARTIAAPGSCRCARSLRPPHWPRLGRRQVQVPPAGTARKTMAASGSGGTWRRHLTARAARRMPPVTPLPPQDRTGHPLVLRSRSSRHSGQ
jgi:hypothetical protein